MIITIASVAIPLGISFSGVKDTILGDIDRNKQTFEVVEKVQEQIYVLIENQNMLVGSIIDISKNIEKGNTEFMNILNELIKYNKDVNTPLLERMQKDILEYNKSLPHNTVEPVAPVKPNSTIGIKKITP